jgi:hypothetical protein
MKCKSNSTTYKVYTNGGNVGFRVGIIRKSEQQTRLSDARVSNQEQFEEVIAAIVIDEEKEQKRLAHKRKTATLHSEKKAAGNDEHDAATAGPHHYSQDPSQDLQPVRYAISIVITSKRSSSCSSSWLFVQAWHGESYDVLGQRWYSVAKYAKFIKPE